MEVPPSTTASLRAGHLERLYRVGLALGSEPDRDRLVETILIEAQELTRADGGTIYLATGEAPPDHAPRALAFAMFRNDSLGVARGGTTGLPVALPPIPLYREDGSANHANIAAFCAHEDRAVNIPDAYDAPGFDFSGTREFDARHGYRSCSFLAIPLRGRTCGLLGVLQLINARDERGAVEAFDPERQAIVEALAAQASVALENRQLFEGQRELFESFMRLIAGAIDAKSPYTGGHCSRVPVLALMLAQAACDATAGPFAGFRLSETEWYELRVAAWLHDCGKVVTPVHVLDKATKLEAIHDRIAEVRARFEILRLEAEVTCLRTILANPAARAVAEQQRLETESALEAELAFLTRANIGGESMADEDLARIRALARREVTIGGVRQPLLSDDEVRHLSIVRGTLTEDERVIINGHMVQTIEMLRSLPFPPGLRQVPEIAGGHHERMDGRGYPKGLFAGDMSWPARMMAIADVFEALTALDRPYKKPKTLSEAMAIMVAMKRDNHLDPVVFDLFVTSGTYKRFAVLHMPPELIDAVDEAALLAVTPKPFALPAEPERLARRDDYLPAYERLREAWAQAVARQTPGVGMPDPEA